MKITFLGHSGYVVEERDKVLIFDFYEGTLPEFSKQAKVYVFASHIHYDHFNKQIFEWEKWHPDIHGRSIPEEALPPPEAGNSPSARAHIRFGGILPGDWTGRISALPSSPASNCPFPELSPPDR